MTAMLEKLRQLDAARKRGDLSDAEYSAARARLIETVEDVDVEPAAAPPRRPRPPRQDPKPEARNPRRAASGEAKPRPVAPPSQATRRTASSPQQPSETTSPDDMSFFWGLVFVGLCAAGLMTFLIGRLIGDITIALTLAVTVFAAVVISAFQRMQN